MMQAIMLHVTKHDVGALIRIRLYLNMAVSILTTDGW